TAGQARRMRVHDSATSDASCLGRSTFCNLRMNRVTTGRSWACRASRESCHSHWRRDRDGAVALGAAMCRRWRSTDHSLPPSVPKDIGVKVETVEDLIVIVARGLVGGARELVRIGALEVDETASTSVQERVVTHVVEGLLVVCDDLHRRP